MAVVQKLYSLAPRPPEGAPQVGVHSFTVNTSLPNNSPHQNICANSCSIEKRLKSFLLSFCSVFITVFSARIVSYMASKKLLFILTKGDFLLLYFVGFVFP